MAPALALSIQSADKLLRTARELGARLPGIGRLLADGTLTVPKAGLVAETFEGLSDADAARAEELLIPELTGTTGKTFAQIERLAAGIADAVDPEAAERRREDAERRRSRVQMFRERAGTAALSGRDLPADETLAAYANVSARAEEYQDLRGLPRGADGPAAGDGVPGLAERGGGRCPDRPRLPPRQKPRLRPRAGEPGRRRSPRMRPASDGAPAVIVAAGPVPVTRAAVAGATAAAVTPAPTTPDR